MGEPLSTPLLLRAPFLLVFSRDSLFYRHSRQSKGELPQSPLSSPCFPLEIEKRVDSFSLVVLISPIFSPFERMEVQVHNSNGVPPFFYTQ